MSKCLETAYVMDDLGSEPDFKETRLFHCEDTNAMHYWYKRLSVWHDVFGLEPTYWEVRTDDESVKFDNYQSARAHYNNLV